MSLEQDVDDILQDQSSGGNGEPDSVLQLAAQEAANIARASGMSLRDICNAVEGAMNKKDLLEALGQFNNLMHIFLEVSSDDMQQSVLDTLGALPSSDRFRELLATQESLAEAIKIYKSLVAKDLGDNIRRREDFLRASQIQDGELIDSLLPPQSTKEVVALVQEIPAHVGIGQGASLSKKRCVESVIELEEIARIPKKKNTIPALAAVGIVDSACSTTLSPKKTLRTRERLRAGLHDPRGLLNLVGSSTNALERTKKLELLKSAGFCFDEKKRNASFSEKLSAATWRLDLGLGGHVEGDTFLFGQKVLSNPGALSNKNVSDIQNNIVDGKTTWKHQNEYAKVMIAGCMNQAKTILNQFDMILFGPPPEKQIEKVHKDLRELLFSQEAATFRDEVDSSDPEAVARGDLFLKSIIEAVPPIVPVALRNKSLDGGYLRTALHFLGAAELMFSRYETDVRRQANPAGVVGMCNAMHSNFEQCTIINKELAPLDNFEREMASQYQTSLGLGLGFPNDAVTRKGRRRNTYNRGRSYQRQVYFGGRGLSRQQQDGLMAGASVAGRGGGPSRAALRSRGLCFGYQNGTCGRGMACRFLHTD